MKKQAPFKNVSAVLEHLQDAGYKIEKSKIYKDKKKGLLRVQDDRTVLAADVELYAATLERDGDHPDVAGDVKEKTRKEIEKLDIQIEKARFDLEKDKGKYVPRRDFEMELAARAAVLETGIKYMFQSNVSEWVALVGGDPMKATDMLERLNIDFGQYLNEYASTEKFQVMIINEDTETV